MEPTPSSSPSAAASTAFPTPRNSLDAIDLQSPSVASKSAFSAVERDDDDANMSNDDAMSDGSSLGIDDHDDAGTAASLALDYDIMAYMLGRTVAQQGQQMASPTKRSASFSDLFASSNGSSRHLSRPASLNYIPTSLSSAPPSGTSPLSLWMNSEWPPPISPQRKRRRQGLWLHAQFAPAMTKSVRRLAPPRDIFPDLEDDLMNGVPVSEPSDGRRRPHRQPWGVPDAPSYQDPEGKYVVAARNEVVGTQLRVLASAPFLLTTDSTNWFLPEGHTPRCRVQIERSYLPQAIQIETFLVGYVEDENGDELTETLDPRGYSEALVVEHIVYLRLRVGSDVPEGTYEVPVRLFTQLPGFAFDEALSWTTTLHVRVASTLLPPPSQWRFHLDLWQHPTSIARLHRVPLWSDAHFTLLDRYFALLAERGQKCVTVVVTEMPWSGQQCYIETQYPSALFEHAILDVYESDTPSHDISEGIHVDFQHFDRLIELAEKYHMAHEIEVFGLVSIWRDAANGFDSPMEQGSGSGESDSGENDKSQSNCFDSWRIRCFNHSTQRFRYLRRVKEVERVIMLFYEHCVSRHLVDRVRVCADEPSSVPLFHAQMAWITRLAPRFQVKVAINHMDFLQYAPPQVVDIVPLLPLVCADREATERWRDQVHAKQGRMSWYVCCVPSYPNQFVSSPLIEGELIGYITFFLRLDGFLRWNYCLWPSKPWDSVRWRTPSWKAGDMYFVLPGLDGFPIETLRFEALRIAVQRFELLCLAKSRLDPVEMTKLESELSEILWRTPDRAWFGRYLDERRQPEDLYSLDPTDYERAHALILETLALVDARERRTDTTTDVLTSPSRKVTKKPSIHEEQE